jgi:glycerol dehydrogenase-like iron-containing ADH family enzyme
MSPLPLTPPTATSPTAVPLLLAPSQVIRGSGVLAQSQALFAHIGQCPLILGGKQALAAAEPSLKLALGTAYTTPHSTHPDCSEAVLDRLEGMVDKYRPDYVIAVGGGKSLDTGKLVAHRSGLPVVTIPTTGATCAAWTALSNVYSDAGAFLYDVPLSQPPRALILDYDLIRTAPPRTLVAGIGDALAKWYEASVSSGQSSQTLVIAAVQQARVLRDLLLQRSVEALEQAGGAVWQEVVDATVLLAGVIGGLGGAQCRTVAAHAIHNGLTHITEAHGTLHGEKVAYGILVQLRLEEMVGGNQLAATARHQLIKFYQSLGLPCELADLGLGKVSLADLQTAATIACRPGSDLHHLPFAVDESEVLAAMVSTLAPSGSAALKSSSPVSQSI